MGHWLVELMTALRAKNLKQLHEELLRAHVLYGDTPISHDLLKKWASSKSVVMPPNAMWPTVSAIPAPDMKDRLATRFFVARALTFLCDFLRSASLTEEAPEWDTIQAQIARRYLELWNSIRAST